jgi:flagellar assembly factor FliW
MPAMSRTVSEATSVIHSRWLGEVNVDPECTLLFPAGLPGFEELRIFVPVEIPAHRPLVYLQSPDDPEICFVALPVYVIDSDFRLQLSDEDRSILQLPEGCDPVVGDDVLCLALLRRSGPTAEANPEAAVVINLHNRIGIQCVPPGDAPQRFRRLAPGGWTTAC